MKRLLKTLCVVATLAVAPLTAADGFEDSSILIEAEEAIKLVGDPKVMFVSGDNSDIYKLGHIRGSVEMYAHGLQHSDIMGNLDCEPMFRCINDAADLIGSKGISNDMMVIAYDDFKGPNATGVYAFFKSYGHKNVKILNGGRAAMMAVDPAQAVYDEINAEYKAERRVAKKAKKKLKNAKKGKIELTEAQKDELNAIIKASKKKQKEIKKRLKVAEKDLIVIKGDEHVEPKTYHINKEDVDLTRIAGKAEVVKAMHDIREKGDDSEYVIIDTRSMIEIIGERKMDNVARGGHIPGAKLIEWNKISDLDNKKSFRSAAEIKEVFEQYGVTKDKTIYAYCHVGTGRSSEIITALEMLGYENAKIYSGSWNGWGNDMNLPFSR